MVTYQPRLTSELNGEYLQAVKDWDPMVRDVRNMKAGFTPSGVFNTPMCKYMLTRDANDYYYVSNAYQLVFGGPSNVGVSDAQDGHEVFQKAVDDIVANGIVYLGCVCEFDADKTLIIPETDITQDYQKSAVGIVGSGWEASKIKVLGGSSSAIAFGAGRTYVDNGWYQNFGVEGTGASQVCGIDLDNVRYSKFIGVQVRNFNKGVILRGTDPYFGGVNEFIGCRMKQVNIGYSFEGIGAANSNSNTIIGGNVESPLTTDSSRGIKFANGTENLVMGVDIEGYEAGIEVASNQNRIICNRFENITLYDIYLNNTVDSTIFGNTPSAALYHIAKSGSAASNFYMERDASKAFTAVSAVTLTGSPFTYTNSSHYPEQIIVQGGTVSEIDFSRNGTDFYNTGCTFGKFDLPADHSIKVTYSSNPAIIKLPLW